MLLCGASFATQAVPVNFTNNYSGVYNCITMGSSECLPSTNAWTLGYDNSTSTIYQASSASWMFTLSGEYGHLTLLSSIGSTVTILDSNVTLMTSAPQVINDDGDSIFTTLFVSTTQHDNFNNNFTNTFAIVGIYSVEAEVRTLYDYIWTQNINEFSLHFSTYIPIMQSYGVITKPYDLSLIGIDSLQGIKLMDSVVLFNAVPEPSDLALILIGFAAFRVSHRRLRG